MLAALWLKMLDVNSTGSDAGPNPSLVVETLCVDMRADVHRPCAAATLEGLSSRRFWRVVYTRCHWTSQKADEDPKKNRFFFVLQILDVNNMVPAPVEQWTAEQVPS